MSAQEKKYSKANAVLDELFQIATKLNEEQQMALLLHAEDLFNRDKRSGLRKSCDIPINYATNDRVYTDQISNISRSGLFINTREPFTEGDEIITTFRLDGFDRPLKIKGTIAHSIRKGVGVKFKNLSPYIEEMIDILVKRMK